MRKMTWMTAVCLGTLVGLGSRPAAAAMVESLKVNLPFAAEVGGVTLPAGEYTIRDLKSDGSGSVLQISDYKGHSVSAMTMEINTPNGRESKDSSVVLRKDGDTYKIQKVFIEGQDIGYEFLSAAE